MRESLRFGREPGKIRCFTNGLWMLGIRLLAIKRSKKNCALTPYTVHAQKHLSFKETSFQIVWPVFNSRRSEEDISLLGLALIFRWMTFSLSDVRFVSCCLDVFCNAPFSGALVFSAVTPLSLYLAFLEGRACFCVSKWSREQESTAYWTADARMLLKKPALQGNWVTVKKKA